MMHNKTKKNAALILILLFFFSSLVFVHGLVQENIQSGIQNNIKLITKEGIIKNCPCNSTIFKFELKNIGNFSESYNLSVDESVSDFTKFSENPILIEPKKSKVFAIKTIPSCDIRNNLSFNLYVKSEKNRITAKVPLTIETLPCYDFDLINGRKSQIIKGEESRFVFMEQGSPEYKLCENTIITVPFLITNKGSHSNKYNLSMQNQQEWSFIQFNELEVNRKKAFNLFLLLPKGLEGDFEFEVNTESEKGQLKKNRTILAKVEKCYTPEIFFETKTITTNYTKKKIDFEITNSGDKDATYIFSTNLRWAEISPNSLNLSAGETEKISLILSPTNRTKEGNYKLAIRAEVLQNKAVYEDYTTIRLKKKLFSPIEILTVTLIAVLVFLLVIFALTKAGLKRREKIKEAEQRALEKEKKKKKKIKVDMLFERARKKKKPWAKYIMWLIILAILIFLALKYIQFPTPSLNISENATEEIESVTEEIENITEEAPIIEETAKEEAIALGNITLEEKKILNFTKVNEAFKKSPGFLLSTLKKIWDYTTLFFNYLILYMYYIILGVAILIILIYLLKVKKKIKIKRIREERKKKSYKWAYYAVFLIVLLLIVFWVAYYFKGISPKEDKGVVENEIPSENITFIEEENISAEPEEEIPAQEEKGIAPLIWNKNDKAEVDLKKYFYDPDNDALGYSSAEVENIAVNIDENGIATLRAVDGWYGNTTIRFTASDGKGGVVESNEVILIVRNSETYFPAMYGGVFNSILAVSKDIKNYIILYSNFIFLGVVILVILILVVRYYNPFLDFLEGESTNRKRERK